MKTVRTKHLENLASRAPNLENLASNDARAPTLARLIPGTGTKALHLDPDVATCQILAALAGGDALPVDAFATLTAHSQRLTESPDEEILDSLTRQSALLEALWLNFAARAARESRVDHSALLCKASLNCQRALQDCLGAIHQLTEVNRNAKAFDA
jgi:hypothetical protein